MGRGKAEGGVIGRPQIDSLYGVDLPCIGDRTDNSEIHPFPTGHKEVVVRADAVAVLFVLHAMATVGLDPLEVALGQVDAGEFSLFQCLMDIVDRRFYQVELSVSLLGSFECLG